MDRIWDSQMSLYRDSFRTRAEYLEAKRECDQHYGYKMRVVGGWRYFEFATDYETAKRQK